MGPRRSRLVSAGATEWIERTVFDRCPYAQVCPDTFHVVQWATNALDEVRRLRTPKMVGLAMGTFDPHAVRMITPRKLAALERGEPITDGRLAYPVAIQGCSGEAEAAAIRGQSTAGACRLVYASPPPGQE